MLDLSAIPVESLASPVNLTRDAASLLKPEASLADALQLLQKQDFAHEAIPLLSEALPDRERAWWASQAAKHATATPTPPQAAAIEAAVTWAKAASPAGAREAAVAAAEAGFGGPAGWAAQSAAWADPTIAGDVAGLSKHAADGALQLAMASDAGTLPGAAMEGTPAAGVGPESGAGVEGPAGAAGAQAERKAPPSAGSVADRRRAAKLAAPYLEMGREIANGLVPW